MAASAKICVGGDGGTSALRASCFLLRAVTKDVACRDGRDATRRLPEGMLGRGLTLLVPADDAVAVGDVDRADAVDTQSTT